MSLTASAAEAAEFISSVAEAERDDSVKALFVHAQELYEKKLWHNLTGTLRQICAVPRFQQVGNDALLQLYNRFVKDFEMRLNRLELAKIVIAASRTFAEPNRSIEFLREFSAKLKDEDHEALALVMGELSLLHIKLADSEAALELAEKAHTMLGDLQGVDPDVSAAYYRALAQYHKQQDEPAKFYRNALLMLLFQPVEELPQADRASLAYDMALAVLTSPDVVNFGELLAHPVLQALRSDIERQWVSELLLAVNSGNRQEFEAIVSRNTAAFNAEPALSSSVAVMREKISLLALVELMFTRGADERTVQLSDVATACAVPLENVEMVLMRAMSLGLIRGSIDEVSGVVQITWVQPRVLDLKQIAQLRDRLANWKLNVKQVVQFVQATSASQELVS